MDGAAARGREARRRQLDRTIAVQRDDRLDRALTKGLGAEQYGPVIVLQSAGDELGLARGTAINQRDDRQPVGKIARGRADTLGIIGLAALDDGDLALVDKGVGHRDRCIKIAARAVAQIDDEADQLVAGLLAQLLDGIGQCAGSRGIEPGEADIGNVPTLDPGADGRKFARGALQLGLDRRAGATTQHQRDLAIGRTAQFLLDLRQGQVVGRLLVDREDQIAGLEAGRRRRRTVARRDHLHCPVVERHDQAGRGALVGGRGFQRLVFVLVQIHRTRIEAGQHAGDRGLDQLLVGDRFDRILPDPLEGLAEQVQLLVDAALAGFLLRQSGHRQQQDGQPGGKKPFTHKSMSPKSGRTLSELRGIAIR